MLLPIQSSLFQLLTPPRDGDMGRSELIPVLSDRALTCSLVPVQIFIFHSVTITVPERFTQCTTRGSFVQHWQETVYNLFTFVCLFLLPLVIMIFCYARILVEISSRMGRGNRE